MGNTLILFILMLFAGITSFSQGSDFVSDAISDCDGGMNIIEPGVFSIQFTGGSGLVADIQNYPSLTKIPENNSIWCSFIAPFNGNLKLDASMTKGFLQMVIFEQGENDICDEIQKGTADIKRLADLSSYELLIRRQVIDLD